MSNEIKIRFKDENNNIRLRTEEDQIQLRTKESITLVVPTQHSQLLGLDYESSGHTGFASSLDLKNYVPKDLSIIPQMEAVNRDGLLYVDNDGSPNTISINTLLDKKVRTVTDYPDDFEVGDYIFQEVNNNG